MAELRADEAGSAGDQYTHERPPHEIEDQQCAAPARIESSGTRGKQDSTRLRRADSSNFWIAAESSVWPGSRLILSKFCNVIDGRTSLGEEPAGPDPKSFTVLSQAMAVAQSVESQGLFPSFVALKMLARGCNRLLPSQSIDDSALDLDRMLKLACFVKALGNGFGG